MNSLVRLMNFLAALGMVAFLIFLEIYLHLVPEHFEAIDGVSLDDLDLILGAVDQGCGVIRGLLGPVHHVVEWLAIAFLPFLHRI